MAQISLLAWRQSGGIETPLHGLPMIRPIVFCKAPVEGHVKTRLQPQFSSAQAANIHAAMAACVIERTLRLFPHTWIATDDPYHPFFHQFDASVLPQGEGDLGLRMSRLTARAIAYGARGVLLLGTDSPHMRVSRLRCALRLLHQYDVVLGPVEDGGYDLLAMRGHQKGLFQGITWGTSAVLNETMTRISELGLSSRCLSMGFDVDIPEDLARLPHSGFNLESLLQNS
ncbi:MAG: TIGR04282 family arsenosugar biosynthesis glycosyltransferase [Mariprofundaceae bacterium]|nr:TIGR04282 family arsenosugar biosynthesis glycosyltransferase [Mariprofundaceae bacterium]